MHIEIRKVLPNGYALLLWNYPKMGFLPRHIIHSSSERYLAAHPLKTKYPLKLRWIINRET